MTKQNVVEVEPPREVKDKYTGKVRDETQDERAKREAGEKVQAQLDGAVALKARTDVLHVVSAAFRKVGHHLQSGRDASRALELVAEELERIATESEAVAPSKEA